MSNILEALAVIKGKDATGGAFDAVAAKIQRISRAASALNRDVQKQLNMAGVAERQVARLDRAHTSIGNGARMAAGAAAAYGAGHAAKMVVEHTYKASAERAHEKVRMEAAGMKPEEIADAEKLAGELSSRYKALSQNDIMHAARNARSIVGTFEEAAEILDPLMKLKVVALGAHPEKADELNEQFDQLIKAEEIKGITQDLPRFRHGMDVMAKALNVFGDTLRPTDFYDTVKYSRQAAVPLSDKFMLETAPTMAQEMKGSSTGKALSTFYGTVVGGKMKNVAADEFNRFGLVDPNKITKTKTGAVKGIKPGGIVAADLAASDPYAWVNDVFLPALAKKGITDPKDIQTEIATMFRDSTAAQLVSVFATQQKRIEKDWALIHGAKGLEAADIFLNDDPKIAAKSVGAQTENMLANLGKTGMPAAAKGLNWLASGLAWASEQADKHPDKAVPGGLLGLGMLSAIGFDGAHSLYGKVFGGGGGNWGATKALAGLAPMLALTQLAETILDDNDIERLKKYEASPRSRFDQLHDLDEKDKAAGIYGDADFESYVKGQNAAKRAAIESQLTDLGFAGPGTPGRGLYAGQYSIDDIRKATGIGGSPTEPAKAEVVGNATLETKVIVEPSPDFLTRIEQKISNGINAFRSTGGAAKGTTGSTGNSMPEATAPM